MFRLSNGDVLKSKTEEKGHGMEPRDRADRRCAPSEHVPGEAPRGVGQQVLIRCRAETDEPIRGSGLERTSYEFRGWVVPDTQIERISGLGSVKYGPTDASCGVGTLLCSVSLSVSCSVRKSAS
jgi:hypothetical protein